ncbi:MAG TPA: LysR substrate-binding domain-containing protein [Noviherbaspirillum sp.]|uniref:LysR substrate-binding domain-containing protein n=1 Tax=Noviherbaspirillum sp. TaxID=1926288 RepID=UPI002D55C318|nr:LysR substrate-binding domain-containing protein [Noviherbaspirillum sp.]HYD95005.1 LysR substrate-binding domain-containing protein [Noviherbaspirillum sp.]
MREDLLDLPPLDALRGFVAVARRMSITLAARDLCLTQSAVSRQVQSLEQHFGTPLLVRTHRAIALTESGRQLFTLASPWLDRLADFTRSVRQDGRPKPVTVTASIGVTALWLLPRLGGFQSAHPHADVRVAANNRTLDLEQEGIDIAIRYCPAARAPEGALRLFGETVVPVASKAVAARAFKTPAALLQQVLLELDERDLPWLHWADWLSARGYAHAKPRSYLRFNQYDQVIQAAIEGHGVALGRLALVQPMLEDGRLVAQRDAAIGVNDYAYWLVQASPAPRQEVMQFAEWILREASQAPGAGGDGKAGRRRARG